MADAAPVQASALLAAVLLELRAVRAAVGDLRDEQQFLARRLLAADDRRGLVRLLPLIDGLMGDKAWTSAGLYAAALNADDAGDLWAVLDEWNTDSGGLRTFGHFLRRSRNCVHAGLRLLRVNESDGDDGIYMVKRVSVASKPPPLLAGNDAGSDDGH